MESVVMPKLKPHKGLMKRVKITKTGKVKRRRTFKSHLMSGKGGGRRRRLRKPVTIVPTEARTVKRLMACG
jgi:large subunit ribosomal protein L35